MTAFGLAVAAQVGLILISFLYAAMSIPPGVPWLAGMAESLAFGIVTLTFPAVGAVVLIRRPSNLAGRLLCVMALGWALANAATSFANYALITREGGVAGGDWALWLSGDSWTIVLSQGLLVLLMLVFPTGTLASPQWRPIARSVAGWTLITALTTAVAAGPLDDFLGLGIANPAAAPAPIGPLFAAIAGPLRAVGLVWFAAAAVSLVLRFRRSHGIERQQIKWIALASVVTVVGISATLVLLNSAGPDGSGANEWLLPLTIVGTLSPVLLPIAIGIAVLRYRLYDIDRIISRTVSYALLTAVLVSVYGVSVLVLGPLLRPLVGSSDLVVAASTLAIAALFSPARRRIQNLVDRRFNRARYDANRTVEEFRNHLRGDVQLGTLQSDLAGLVGSTLQPSSISVWLRRNDKPG